MAKENCSNCRIDTSGLTRTDKKLIEEVCKHISPNIKSIIPNVMIIKNMIVIKRMIIVGMEPIPINK